MRSHAYRSFLLSGDKGINWPWRILSLKLSYIYLWRLTYLWMTIKNCISRVWSTFPKIEWKGGARRRVTYFLLELKNTDFPGFSCQTWQKRRNFRKWRHRVIFIRTSEKFVQRLWCGRGPLARATLIVPSLTLGLPWYGAWTVDI